MTDNSSGQTDEVTPEAPEDQLAPPAAEIVTEAVPEETPAVEATEADTQIADLLEKIASGSGRKFKETIEGTTKLQEAKAGKPRRLYATAAFADVVNQNRRRYRSFVLRAAVEEAKSHLHESLKSGRAILTGEVEHPSDKWMSNRGLLETMITWDSIEYDEDTDTVQIAGDIIETAAGKDAILIMDAGVMPGVSLRGRGEVQPIIEDDDEILEVQWVKFNGFDLVMNPSFQDAAVDVLEAEKQPPDFTQAIIEAPPAPAPAADPIKDTKITMEKETQDVQAIVAEMLEARELAAATAAAKAAEDQKQKAIRDMLGIDEDADVLTALNAHNAEVERLREAADARAAATLIADAVGKLKYPAAMQKRFIEFVGSPKNTKEAAAKLAEATAIYDAAAAEAKLAGMGFAEGTGLHVVGPVFEGETGQPAFAAPSFAITENLIALGEAQRREINKPRNRNEAYAQRYINHFDKQYKRELMAEAAIWQEAETTTQLNLPYSVLRAVALEAFPTLVAAGIFDMGVMNSSPEKIFYQAAFEGESGYANTVTDESTTSSHDAWVALTYKNVDWGSVVVTSSPAGTTYTEGSDFLIDYREGQIKVLSTGTMADATAFLVDYTYNAIRKGEGAAIQKARMTIAGQTLEAFADRLATEITREAIAFSRSQLNTDAVTQTIALLIREVNLSIDNGIFNMALSSVLGVASNSGGTWTAASDDPLLLAAKIGAAKVKVANRYYQPSFVLMSLTNSDLLANGSLFTAAGARSDGSLNSEGYVGEIKGLPAFASTEFPDSYVLVGNKQLVMHRTFSPMQLQGPFPSYDASNNLIAAEQYYLEEFNGQISPIPGKGSYVVVA